MKVETMETLVFQSSVIGMFYCCSTYWVYWVHCESLKMQKPQAIEVCCTCVSALIGRHMASLATLMKPMAMSSILIWDSCALEALLDDWLVERKWLISCVSLQKCFMVSSFDKGSFSPGPNIFGKKEGSRRPRARLASVTVRGPPEEKQNKYVL